MPDRKTNPQSGPALAHTPQDAPRRSPQLTWYPPLKPVCPGGPPACESPWWGGAGGAPGGYCGSNRSTTRSGNLVSSDMPDRKTNPQSGPALAHTPQDAPRRSPQLTWYPPLKPVCPGGPPACESPWWGGAGGAPGGYCGSNRSTTRSVGGNRTIESCRHLHVGI